MMSSVKYEKLYANGNYSDCKKELQDLYDRINYEDDVLSFINSSQLDSVALNIDPHILLLMLEGNRIVTENLDCLTSSISLGEGYIDLLYNYCRKIHDLICNNSSIPLSLYLNSVRNVLWMSWICGMTEDVRKDQILNMLINCSKQVLFSCGCQTQHSLEDHREKQLQQLLFNAVKSISRLEILECLQVVEIILLYFLVFSELNQSSDILKLSLCLLKDSWNIIKARFISMGSGYVINRSKALQLFKFGFSQINETTGGDLRNMRECLCVMTSLCLYKMGYAEDSLVCLLNERDGNSCNFLWNYMQAFISLSKEEVDVCLLYLQQLPRLRLNDLHETHLYYLQGRYFSSLQQMANAHFHYVKMLHSSPKYFYSALMSILKNIKSRIHSLSEKYVDVKGWDSILCKYIQGLHCIFRFVQNRDMTLGDPICSFDEKILNILHQGNSYKKKDVLHIIAEELLWIQVNDFVPDIIAQYPNAIGDFYMEILYKNFTNIGLLHDHDSTSSCIINHQSVVAMMLEKKINDAEIICNYIVKEKSSIRKGSVDVEANEIGLFLMKDGTIANLYLALIMMHKGIFQEAHSIVGRIKRNILQYYFSVPNQGSSHKPSLLDAILAKVYVLNAALLLKIGFKNDALKNCERAVIHNPGPEILEDCVKIAQIIGTEITIPSNRSAFPVKKFKCLAIVYFLTMKLQL